MSYIQSSDEYRFTVGPTCLGYTQKEIQLMVTNPQGVTIINQDQLLDQSPKFTYNKELIEDP